MATPVPLNDPRYALTVDSSGMLTVEHVTKAEDPVNELELARIKDVFGTGAYKDVVWLGKTPPTTLVSGSTGVGYLVNPATTLADAVNTAVTRFTPTANNRVLIVAVNADTTETASCTLASPYVDLVTIGRCIVRYPSGVVFNLTSGGGNTISGLFPVGTTNFIALGALTSTMRFTACDFTGVTGAPVAVASGTSTSPVEFEGCTASGTLVQNPVGMTVRARTHRQTGTSTLVTATANAALEVIDSSFQAAVTGLSVSTASLTASVMLRDVRMNAPFTAATGSGAVTLDWSNVTSTSTVAAPIVSAPASTLSGILNNVRATTATFGAAQGILTGLTLRGVAAVLSLSASTVYPDVLLENCSSQNTPSAFGTVFTVTGLNAARVKACDFAAEVSGPGVFCGQVDGGAYYGIGRIASAVVNTINCAALINNCSLGKYTVSGTVYYPTLAVAGAGATTTSNAQPSVVHGVQSQGIFSSEMLDWYTEDGAPSPTRDRSIIVSDSSFTIPSGGILKYRGTTQTMVLAPSVGANDIIESVLPEVTNPDGRIWVTGVSRLPREDASARAIGATLSTPVPATTVHYAEGIAARFGNLNLSLADAIIQNPPVFLESLGIIGFICRIPQGQRSCTITHPKLTPWTTLSYQPKPGQNISVTSSTVRELATASHAYVGQNMIKITVKNPIEFVTHFDFIALTYLAVP